MKDINEIDAQIKKILGYYRLINKKIINQYLQEILQDNEDIKAFALGVYENKQMNLVTTNKRVIIFNKGFIKCTQVEIPIEKINSIGQNIGLIYGEIHIWDSSSKISITKVPIKQVELFVKSTNEQLNNYKSFKIEVNKTVEKDITDKIEKLAELYKEGILTEYEFTIKKMELLENLKK